MNEQTRDAVIVPIVEGQSEERSIGVLTRRVLHERDAFDIQVARPFRVKRNRIVRSGEIERSVIQAERSRPARRPSWFCSTRT